MTPEQEKKFEEWYTWVMNNGALVSLKPSARQTWQACLDANGLEKTGIKVKIPVVGWKDLDCIECDSSDEANGVIRGINLSRKYDIYEGSSYNEKQLKQHETKKSVQPSFEDTCKAFESLAYSITKASDKLAEAISRGCEKAEKGK